MDQEKARLQGQKRKRSASGARSDDQGRATMPGGTPNTGAGVGPGRTRDPLVHPGDEQDITPDVIAGQGQPSKGGASHRGGHVTTDSGGNPPGGKQDAGEAADRKTRGDRQ
jgi:hypothetical protein